MSENFNQDENSFLATAIADAKVADVRREFSEKTNTLRALIQDQIDDIETKIGTKIEQSVAGRVRLFGGIGAAALALISAIAIPIFQGIASNAVNEKTAEVEKKNELLTSTLTLLVAAQQIADGDSYTDPQRDLAIQQLERAARDPQLANFISEAGIFRDVVTNLAISLASAGDFESVIYISRLSPSFTLLGPQGTGVLTKALAVRLLEAIEPGSDWTKDDLSEFRANAKLARQRKYPEEAILHELLIEHVALTELDDSSRKELKNVGRSQTASKKRITALLAEASELNESDLTRFLDTLTDYSTGEAFGQNSKISAQRIQTRTQSLLTEFESDDVIACAT